MCPQYEGQFTLNFFALIRLIRKHSNQKFSKCNIASLNLATIMEIKDMQAKYQVNVLSCKLSLKSL